MIIRRDGRIPMDFCHANVLNIATARLYCFLGTSERKNRQHSHMHYIILAKVLHNHLGNLIPMDNLPQHFGT